jgi:hypothetical protein
MKTSRTRGRLSASRPTARTAVGASSHPQMPPFQRTISSSSAIAGNLARTPCPGTLRGGSDETPKGTVAMTDSNVGSRSYTLNWIRRSASIAPSQRSRCFSLAHMKWWPMWKADSTRSVMRPLTSARNAAEEVENPASTSRSSGT